MAGLSPKMERNLKSYGNCHKGGSQGGPKSSDFISPQETGIWT